MLQPPDYDFQGQILAIIPASNGYLMHEMKIAQNPRMISMHDSSAILTPIGEMSLRVRVSSNQMEGCFCLTTRLPFPPRLIPHAHLRITAFTPPHGLHIRAAPTHTHPLKATQ